MENLSLQKLKTGKLVWIRSGLLSMPNYRESIGIFLYIDKVPLFQMPPPPTSDKSYKNSLLPNHPLQSIKKIDTHIKNLSRPESHLFVFDENALL